MKTLLTFVLCLLAIMSQAANPSSKSFRGTGGILVTSNDVTAEITINGTGVAGSSVTNALLTNLVNNPFNNYTNTAYFLSNSVAFLTYPYNIFYDDFTGVPEMGRVGMLARKSLSGHTYLITGTCSNHFHLKDGYIENTNTAGTAAWYLMVTNGTAAYGKASFDIPQANSWTRMGMVFSYLGTFSAGLAVAGMATLDAESEASINNTGVGVHSGFYGYLLSMQRGVNAEQIIPSANFWPFGVDNIYVPTKHIFEIQWSSNSFQIRMDDAVYNGYSTNGLSWAVRNCIFFEDTDSTANSGHIKIHTIWAGKAYPEYTEREASGAFTPASGNVDFPAVSGARFLRYTTPTLIGGNYTNAITDIHVGYGLVPSVGATNTLPPSGTYWSREITIFDALGTANGGVSNITILTQGTDKINKGLSSTNITNSAGSITLRSGPYGWSIVTGGGVPAGSGGGSGGTNFPAVINNLGNTNIAVGSGKRQSITITTNASFKLVFTGTPLNGEHISLAVSNTSTSTIFVTNTTGIFDPTVASNVTTFAVSGTSIKFWEFVAQTNFNLGTVRWEARDILGKELELRAGLSTTLTTNASGDIILVNAPGYFGGVLVTNGVSFVTALIAGTGGGTTNYTLQATDGHRYINGNTPVSLRAVMQYTNGIVSFPYYTITNGGGSDKTLEFSAVTNNWHPSFQQGGVLPSNLTNMTALKLSLEVDGTNVWVSYAYYTWP